MSEPDHCPTCGQELPVYDDPPIDAPPPTWHYVTETLPDGRVLKRPVLTSLDLTDADMRELGDIP